MATPNQLLVSGHPPAQYFEKPFFMRNIMIFIVVRCSMTRICDVILSVCLSLTVLWLPESVSIVVNDTRELYTSE